jgi:hypothetical protein
MMWTQTRRSRPPEGVSRVLEMLETAAEPWERGLRWPLTSAEGLLPDQFWPGWCHGNAGYVFLRNLARAVYGEDRFATLAERAAWLVDRSPGFTSLCCGSAGQAYALLNQYEALTRNGGRRKSSGSPPTRPSAMLSPRTPRAPSASTRVTRAWHCWPTNSSILN